MCQAEQTSEVVALAYVGGVIGYRCEIHLDSWNGVSSVGAFVGNERTDTYVHHKPSSIFFCEFSLTDGSENRRLKSDFDFVMVIGQLIWGIFLGAPCIFGMELMWGKWRVS